MFGSCAKETFIIRMSIVAQQFEYPLLPLPTSKPSFSSPDTSMVWTNSGEWQKHYDNTANIYHELMVSTFKANTE